MTHADHRERYASIKRQVAAQGFDDAMLYNNAKAWVVYDLYEKIFAADTEHHHDPRPRPDAPPASDGAWAPAPILTIDPGDFPGATPPSGDHDGAPLPVTVTDGAPPQGEPS